MFYGLLGKACDGSKLSVVAVAYRFEICHPSPAVIEVVAHVRAFRLNYVHQSNFCVVDWLQGAWTGVMKVSPPTPPKV